MGKWENLFLVFHFSIRLRRRIRGNVGIAPSFGEIPKGLVGRVGSLLSAFRAFQQPRHFHGSLRLAEALLIGYCGPGSFFFLLFFSR